MAWRDHQAITEGVVNITAKSHFHYAEVIEFGNISIEHTKISTNAFVNNVENREVGELVNEKLSHVFVY
jgi:hypothetical protein